RELRCDAMEWHAGGQPSRPIEVGRQVTITQLEPGTVGEPGEGRLGGERVALDTPTTRLVGHTGQPVGDGIKVRGDIEAVPPHVVAGVPDDGDLLRRYHPHQPPKESRCPDAARQDGDGSRTHSSIIEKRCHSSRRLYWPCFKASP